MKKNLFRILSLVLVLATCFTLFACNDGSDGEDEDEGFNPYPYKDLSVYMDMPDYKSLSISQKEIDDTMRMEIFSFFSSKNLLLDITDSGLQKYDTVQLFYIAYVDGQYIQELSCRKFDEYSIPVELYIGNDLLPFESEIIGMKAGETKMVSVTLPEDYPYITYRGVEARFDVEIVSVARAPELTDEICTKYSIYENKEEFLEALKANCIFDYAWQTLIGQCRLKGYPNKEYTEYYQYFYGYFEAVAESYGMSFEDFLKKKGGYYSSYGLWTGMTKDEFRQLASSNAESNVVNDLLTYSIMRAENIAIEGQEWESAKAIFEKEYGQTYDQIVKSSGETAAIISVLTIRISQVINGYVTITSN